MSPPDGILAVVLLQVAPPEPPAVEIVGRQLAVAEMGHDDPAVGDRRGAGQVLPLGKLLMAPLRRRLVGLLAGHGGIEPRATWRTQTILPSFLSTLISTNWRLSTWLVRKTASPQTIGVLLPQPGSGHFQTMPAASLQATGNSFSPETPSPLGPRHCGQLPAQATAGADHPAQDQRAAGEGGKHQIKDQGPGEDRRAARWQACGFARAPATQSRGFSSPQPLAPGP